MKHIKSILSALMAVGLMFAGAAQGEMIARAEEGETAERPVLAITPTQRSFQFEPGETYTGTFNVRNTGTGTLKYDVSVTPYSVKSKTYEVDYKTETQYTDIVDWITLDTTSGTAEAGQDSPVNYTIKIPEDAHGGAQAMTIIVKSKNTSGGVVSASSELGYLIYGDVAGELNLSAEITNNKIPNFLFNPPVIATSAVRNDGNAYARATYVLDIYPLFGGAAVYTNANDPERQVIFPETEKDVELTWKDSPRLGIFRVKQTIKVLDKESVTEKLVFICPMWFLITLIALAGVMAFWIVQRARKRKGERKVR